MSTWRFINWEPLHRKPHIFSRKGFLAGFVGGFIPWLLFGIAQNYPRLQKISGPMHGLENMGGLFIFLLGIGLYALANATARSIAQYTLWRANSLPHRTLGAFGLVLILVATGLQAVQPLIDILNNVR